MFRAGGPFDGFSVSVNMAGETLICGDWDEDMRG